MSASKGQEIMALGEDGDVGAVANIVEDIEEGEAPGICAVCGQLEPPGFDPDSAGTGDSECPVSYSRIQCLLRLPTKLM